MTTEPPSSGLTAPPTVKKKVEAEQNKCAHLITGCIRLTRTASLLAEADLVPLTIRAKQLAGYEHQRILRLPDDDPVREQMTLNPLRG